MVFVVFFSGKHFEKKNFNKLIVRFEISSKNHIFRYKYFRRNKWSITSKLKKKVPLKKIRSPYHKASEISPVILYIHTYVHTYTHTHIQTFFKNRVFSFLGSQNVLICQKIKISPITMVPLWFLYEELKIIFYFLEHLNKSVFKKIVLFYFF